jgi:hypothetical protein
VVRKTIIIYLCGDKSSGVTYTLGSPEISHIFHLNCAGGEGVKLTDGEATFGGMRVEMVRRKARDMADRSSEPTIK